MIIIDQDECPFILTIYKLRGNVIVAGARQFHYSGESDVNIFFLK